LRSKIRIFHKGEISVIWAKMARMREVASTGIIGQNTQGKGGKEFGISGEPIKRFLIFRRESCFI
jgi:hypothetical protein